MDFIIRRATEADMARVLELINELAIYEKEPHAVEISEEDLIADGFGPHPVFTCFVAQVQERVEGIALIYGRYSTWKGKVLHLEDLIVNQQLRGKGLGKALLDEVVRHGHQLGVKRICWEVLDWNQPAIDFYEKNGAHVKRDWDIVHLTEEGIAHYIAALPHAHI